MAKRDPHTHISTEDARGGVTPHVTRYVLAVSMVLIIIIFAWLFMRAR
ncbi:MAG: hypothetical protein K2P79_00275 [Sphingomonas sp.]|nr:hypothetical protein [Sphingomonas sp.]